MDSERLMFENETLTVKLTFSEKKKLANKQPTDKKNKK